MFGNALQGWHLLVIILVILLLFGAPKLPGLARSLGQSMKIFKKEISELNDSKSTDDATAESVADAGDDEPVAKKPAAKKTAAKKPASK